jgi:hypothetical protein
MNKTVSAVIIVLVVLAVIAIIVKVAKKNKEGYSELMISNDDAYVQRPTYKADLSPRFDPYRTGGGYIKSAFAPLEMQAAGVSPLSDNEYVESATGSLTENFDNDFASVATEKENVKEFTSSCGKIGEDVVSEFKKAQGYMDPSQMLPLPDVRSCLKDPSDPENYMYDRTLFAPLKRRHADIPVDYIRGDIFIPPIRSGWFDTPSIPSVDLQKGAISIITDPAIDSTDTIYSRGASIRSPQEEEQEEFAKKYLPFGDTFMHFP